MSWGQKVVLYYPNNWKRYIGNLATPEEKKFNWFLCSKRYKDPATGLFISEIARGTKFYEESTGKTLVIPLLTEEEKEKSINVQKVRLLIVDEIEINPEELVKMGYQGIAKLQKCTLPENASDELMVCKEAEFIFLSGVLEDSQKEKLCPIIDYSKRNNKCIRSKIPDFPTCEEIDNTLNNFQCSAVCKVLYEYIYLYLSKL